MDKPAFMEMMARAKYPRILLQLLGTALAAGAMAQSNAPVQVLPRTILTSPSPTYLKNKFFVPPAPGAPEIPQSPLPTTNFAVLFGANVPDTQGAVGKDQLMSLMNDGYNIQARSGSSTATNSLPNFWNITDKKVFDPRIVYDPYENRWVAISGVDNNTTNSGIFVGVSLTSNPTNGWNRLRIKADTNSLYWADYPTLGFNKDWIVVQANMYGLTNDDLRSHIWVFNKTNLYAGGSNTPTFFALTNANTAGNEVPAVTYDPSLSTMYLLQNANGNTNGSGHLRLFSITGAVGSETLNNVTTASYTPPADPWGDLPTNVYNFAPQSNSTERLATIPDARMTGVVYRNGSLWAVQTVFLPTNNVSRSAVQWWQIKPASSDVLQVGRIDDPAGVNFYSFPSIAVNRFDDVLIGYSSFSSNQYASASYSFRTFYDPKNVLRSPRTYWPGEAIFTLPRWGDYSATVIDPLNDTDLWTLQEYAGPLIGDGESQWGTRWAQVTLAVPDNDFFTNAVIISGVQGSTNRTNIRATKEAGEPDHAGNTNSVSVWYRWTAPTNGTVTFQATNNFNITLAAYTGSAVGSLTLVTNVQAPAGSASPQLAYGAVAGTTYQIAVDGYPFSPDNQGDFQLTWSQPTVPIILTDPEGTNVVANMNEDALFTVWAIGNPTPTNQWRFKGINSTDTWANIASATNATHSIVNVQTNHAGYYVVIAGNTLGAVTSSVATLFVHADSAGRQTLEAYTNGTFRFHIFGLTNRAYRIDTSTNLNSPTNWYSIFTNTVSYWFTNASASNSPQRFYRAITN